MNKINENRGFFAKDGYFHLEDYFDYFDIKPTFDDALVELEEKRNELKKFEESFKIKWKQEIRLRKYKKLLGEK